MVRSEVNKNTPREIRLDENFKPFEGMTFPKVEIEEHNLTELLSSDFVFEGIQGKIKIMADPTVDEAPSVHMPLGKARLIKEYDVHEAIITETPVFLTLELRLTDSSQPDKLRDRALRFDIGQESVYFALKIEDEDVISMLQQGLEEPEYYYLAENEDQKTGFIILPFDITGIRSIDAIIVERVQKSSTE